jgi:hypothetical protein
MSAAILGEAELREAMAGLYAELLREHGRAVAKVDDVAWRTSSGTLERTRAGLAAAAKIIGSLEPKAGLFAVRVLKGEKTWTDYQAQAKVARDSIQYVMTEFGLSYSPGLFWDMVVVKSATDAKQLALKAADTGLDALPWIAAAVIAVAIAYVVFTLLPVLTSVKGAADGVSGSLKSGGDRS